MNTLKNLELIQNELNKRNLDGWIVPDYRGSNEVFEYLVGSKAFMTRRAVIFIPAAGNPKALVHLIDKPQFAQSANSFDVEYFRTWQDYGEWISETLKPLKKVASEYSPSCAIPTMSSVDAGTMELLIEHVEVVSSADIFQNSVSAWTLSDYEGHKKSVEETVASLRSALDFVGSSLNGGKEINEYEVQQYIVEQFTSRGLITDEDPIVAVAPNNGSPHYQPNADLYSPITEDSLLLIDLWAKFEQGDCVYADITWMSYFGKEINKKYAEVFSVVANARDAAIEFARDNIAKGNSIQGFQVDDVSRKVIVDAGYGDYFIHRTGHSMGPGHHLHARGVNIDNFETHDTRSVTSSVGFSIEPGIYLPEFGIRSEVDVFVHPEQGVIVTTPLQSEIEHFALD